MNDHQSEPSIETTKRVELYAFGSDGVPVMSVAQDEDWTEALAWCDDRWPAEGPHRLVRETTVSVITTIPVSAEELAANKENR